MTPFHDEVEAKYDRSAERLRHPVYQIDLQLMHTQQRVSSPLAADLRSEASSGALPLRPQDLSLSGRLARSGTALPPRQSALAAALRSHPCGALPSARVKEYSAANLSECIRTVGTHFKPRGPDLHLDSVL